MIFRRSVPPFLIAVFGAVGLASAQAPTGAEVATILNLQNQARCAVNPPAENMPALTWDPLLAQVAQAHAEQEQFEFNVDRTTDYAALGGSGYVGETIAIAMTDVSALFRFTHNLNSAAAPVRYARTTRWSRNACRSSASSRLEV